MNTSSSILLSRSSLEREFASYIVRAEAMLLDLGILCGLSREEVLASLKLEYERRGGANSFGDLLDWSREYAAEHGCLPFMTVVQFPGAAAEGSAR